MARRPLLLPDEILRLGPNQQVCFVSGKNPPLKPILGGRWPYYLLPEFAGAYLPNPNHPPYDRVTVAPRFGKAVQWKVWTHEVLPDLADLPQFQQGMMSYAAKAPLIPSTSAGKGARSGFLARAARFLPGPKTAP